MKSRITRFIKSVLADSAMVNPSIPLSDDNPGDATRRASEYSNMTGTDARSGAEVYVCTSKSGKRHTPSHSILSSYHIYDWYLILRLGKSGRGVISDEGTLSGKAQCRINHYKTKDFIYCLLRPIRGYIYIYCPFCERFAPAASNTSPKGLCKNSRVC